jgi:hypothetical protein
MWYIQILFSRKHDGKSFVVNILIEEQRKYKIVKKTRRLWRGKPGSKLSTTARAIQHRTSELDENNTRIKVGKNTRLA